MWVKVEDSVVIEVTDIDPKGRYHPSIKWTKAPKGVQPGWLYKDEEFLKPSNQEQDFGALDVRMVRDSLLQKSDYLAMRDYPNPPKNLIEYRQALRDITQQAGFPHTVEWPTLELN